jgi:hypothetical protein
MPSSIVRSILSNLVDQFVIKFVISFGKNKGHGRFACTPLGRFFVSPALPEKHMLLPIVSAQVEY